MTGRVLTFLFLWLALPVAGLRAQAPDFSGRVVDENGVPVIGAKVALSSPDSPVPLEADCDEAGRFVIRSLKPGAYQLRAAKVGYYAFVLRSFEVGSPPGPIEIVLNHRQEFEETVNVVYSAPVIDHQESAVQTTLNAEEITDLPFPASHDFRNALPLMPGIVKDKQGRVHLNGGAESQAYSSLDGFNISNPVSGVLENRVSVDAIRSVRVESSRYSVEYGKGSAGVMALETARGDDHYRFSATNFIPSFEDHDGLHISNWNPRGTASGPIRRGRAWYFNALDLQYDMNIVDELPRGANDNRNWSGSNRSLLQVNLTPANLLTFGVLINFFEANHYGITAFDPLETTRNRKERFYFFHIKDQAYLSGGWVVEAGLGLNSLHNRDLPLGDSAYTISPSGRSGNYFMRREGTTERLQALTNVTTPYWNWRGRHSLKFGLDANLIRYSLWTDRQPVEIRREQGTLSRFVFFDGGSTVRRESSEFSAYLQDRWSLREDLLVEAGFRLDWDQVLRAPLISPRIAATLSPRQLRGSKFSAGVGVFHDAINLGLLARGLDQERIDTFYQEDGISVLRGPIRSRFVTNERQLDAPYHINWSISWEQQLWRSIHMETTFMHRRGGRGWAFDLAAPAGMTAADTYWLSSAWREKYTSLETSLRGMLAGKYSWLLSYVRSSARSSAVLDLSLDNLVYGRQGSGPADWDVPNRLISNGIVPVPKFKRLTLAYFLEWHTGFPYGVVDDMERRVGEANSLRFPDYFSLNLHLERRFRFWKTEWALRAGYNNITDSRNPVIVNNNMMSPQFGDFRGGQGRVFTGRLRFLGKS